MGKAFREKIPLRGFFFWAAYLAGPSLSGCGPSVRCGSMQPCSSLKHVRICRLLSITLLMVTGFVTTLSLNNGTILSLNFVNLSTEHDELTHRSTHFHCITFSSGSPPRQVGWRKLAPTPRRVGGEDGLSPAV